MRTSKAFFFGFLSLLLGFLLTEPFSLWCQGSSSEVSPASNMYCPECGGFKYFKNYSRKDYDHHAQNWCIVQDKRGIIYVGNAGGVLEYDGVDWRIIKIPNSVVRSMALHHTGTLYAGGNDEIGYLRPDSKGKLQYISLMEHLPANRKSFYNVWRTHSTSGGIYFRTWNYLFRWNPKPAKFTIWESQHRFNASFKCNGKLYIHDRKVGLMHIVNDSLELVPGGEKLIGIKVFMMVPYSTAPGRQTFLIGSRSKGFYIFDGSKMTRFPTRVDEYVKKSNLAHGVRLSSSPAQFALATLRGGLIIIDVQGDLQQVFVRSSGLQDDNIKYVYEDSRGNLWLALSNGVSKIEYASPFSIYDRRSGLPGIVSSVTRHNNTLYVGTDTGLYFLAAPSTFRLVPGMTQNFWSLLSAGGSLLAAASNGVFQVENNTRSKKVLELRSYCLVQSGKNPNRVWVGTASGLASLYLADKKEGQFVQWSEERQIENISGKISTIVEDPNGTLWLGTETKGILKVDFQKGTTPVTVTNYDALHGLPIKESLVSKEIRVFMAAGHVMFATAKGIYRFDKARNVFIHDFTFGKRFADSTQNVFCIIEDHNKHVWLHAEAVTFHAIPQKRHMEGNTGMKFVLESKSLFRIPETQVNIIYPDPNGQHVWFGSSDGLTRFDKNFKKNYRQDFPALIRNVVVNGKEKIFNGCKIDKDIQAKSEPFFPIVPYEDRNLRFEFAAPFFENESAATYRFFLEGYDEDWSDWTSETRKDYTNLDAGIHRFRVQAKNVYGHDSREDVFRFRVLPPWYQTWWAYSLYVAGFLLVIYFTVRWRSRKLELEKQRLEQIIKERTREIEEKNIQLEEQSEQLKEMDQVKSRFFANISHEFRTPLTLIMGPLEQMLSTSRSKQQVKQINLMIRNSQRLLTLINQLLDLSKLDSGKIKLQARPQYIVPFLKGVLASFELAGAQKKIDLKFHAESEDITLYFDPEKLEDVICNLLINAFKFTPAGGEITVTVKMTSPGSVDISVRDTGAGIPEDQLEHIFERFYQAKGRDERGGKGSGIGLALARELVALHHGEIHVTSKAGENSGTEFITRLPLGKAHLKPEEIVEGAVPSGPEPAKPGKTPGPSWLDIDKEKEMKREEEEDVEVDVEEKVEKEIGKSLILVVEDNAEMRDYIRGALEPQYSVVEAADGREGIDKAKEIIPDLIISDIMMPEVDGYELCDVLKKDVTTSHVPVVLLTARASAESIIRGLETGADDYITKPFNTTILKTRIKNLIDLRLQLQLKIQRQMVLQPAEISVSSIDQEFMKELQELIEKNLSDPEFNVEELCKKLYMSRATLYRKVMALTGESPIEFIRSYRLKRAAQLFKANFGNVTEVAFEVGFSSTPYFTKCFKEKFHQLPSSFQAAEVSESVSH